MKLPAKETLDRLGDLTSLAQKAIPATGVWILFCYCLSERIMPDGLSLGDALVLIMIALGFGVVLSVGVGYGMIAALVPAKLIVAIGYAKKERKPSFAAFWQDKLLTTISGLLLLLLIPLVLLGVYSRSAGDMKLAQTAGCFFVIGLILLLFFAVQYEEAKPRSLTWNLLLGAVAILTPFAVLHPAVMNITMTALGIRSAAGSLVVISNADFQRVEEVVKQSGLRVHFCQLSKSGDWGTTDARVIWHGVGTTSFVSFLDRPSSGRYAIAMPVPKASLQVITPGHWKLSCDKTLSGEAIKTN